MSLVLREPGALVTLAAGVAVAEVVGGEVAGVGAKIRWPNDVVLGDGRKVAGILAEGRPQEEWAVLGIGVNVAVRAADLPPELRDRAGSLDLRAEEIPRIRDAVLRGLGRWLTAPAEDVLAAWGQRDALLGRSVRWAAGAGTGAGVDRDGRLLVALDDGRRVALEAGEVHLEPG
ncbi:MAG: BirA family transcriptional regulator [Solirubrobacteraceae bacterium]|jgi:BirA family biotin operon repressor/biotin-[acetyl-CoA-carboxylase] ligase|nr:BirA family transcriptional regulator [Solirubrobacteraceae bacterium]